MSHISPHKINHIKKKKQKKNLKPLNQLILSKTSRKPCSWSQLWPGYQKLLSYGEYGSLMTAVRLVSHFTPPFQNLSNDHHHTCLVSPSATLIFTRASYHRLRGWAVSGMLLRAAPSSMKTVERRRDARKPEIHNRLCEYRSGTESKKTANSLIIKNNNN